MREEDFSRKGQFLFQVLLAATIAPTAFLLRREYVEFVLIQLISMIILYAFISNYPELKRFGKKYFFVQLMGMLFGIIVFFNPNHVVGVTVLYLALGLSFVKTYIEVGKILSESKKK